jgi:hypothetical protein
MHFDWILFEAGALSRMVKNTHVCPALVGLEPADVQGPIAQFQATRANREEIIATINGALGDNALPDAHLIEAFEMWWPKLDEVLQALPPDKNVAKARRSDRDIPEELLALVRSQGRGSDIPVIDRLYTPGHAVRRAERALSLVVSDGNYDGSINGWKLEKEGSQINVEVETDRGHRTIRLPISFQSMDALRSAILARLRGTCDSFIRRAECY